MITNATTTWLLATTLLCISLLGVLKVASEYQFLGHEAESHAIQVARLLASSDFSDPQDGCRSVSPPIGLQITRCLADDRSVSVTAIIKTDFLKNPIEIAATARVGYGFYSQMGAREG